MEERKRKYTEDHYKNPPFECENNIPFQEEYYIRKSPDDIFRLVDKLGAYLNTCKDELLEAIEKKQKIDVDKNIDRNQFFKRIWNQKRYLGYKKINFLDILTDRYGNVGYGKNYDVLSLLLRSQEYVNNDPKIEFLAYKELSGNLYYNLNEKKLTTNKFCKKICPYFMRKNGCIKGNNCFSEHINKDVFFKLLLEYIEEDYKKWLIENNL